MTATGDPVPNGATPHLGATADGRGWRATGDWRLATLTPQIADIRRALAAARGAGRWDLSRVTALDSTGALLLLDSWNGALPAELDAREAHRRLLAQMRAIAPGPTPPAARARRLPARGIRFVGERVLAGLATLAETLTLLGQLLLDLVALARAPRAFPLRELSATLYKAGLQALPITGLVGLLIGIVLSYLSARQLRLFGAEAMIVDLVGLTTARQLGPLLAAILVAGRSGSAITAELGVMRLTEELDALRVIGVSPFQRLVVPKVLALGVLMPLVALWTSLCAIGGGMLVARFELGVTPGQFLATLPGAIPVGTYWLSVWMSVAFGLVIGVVACHHGLRVQPNTESLGAETTRSVVTAITLVILVDALFAVAFRNVGWYD